MKLYWFAFGLCRLSILVAWFSGHVVATAIVAAAGIPLFVFAIGRRITQSVKEE